MAFLAVAEFGVFVNPGFDFGGKLAQGRFVFCEFRANLDSAWNIVIIGKWIAVYSVEFRSYHVR